MTQLAFAIKDADFSSMDFNENKAIFRIAASSKKSIVFETESGDFITLPRPESVEVTPDAIYEVTLSSDGDSIILVEQPSFKEASKTATAANQTPNFNEKFSGMSRYKD